MIICGNVRFNEMSGEIANFIFDDFKIIMPRSHCFGLGPHFVGEICLPVLMMVDRDIGVTKGCWCRAGVVD